MEILSSSRMYCSNRDRTPVYVQLSVPSKPWESAPWVQAWSAGADDLALELGHEEQMNGSRYVRVHANQVLHGFLDQTWSCFWLTCDSNGSLDGWLVARTTRLTARLWPGRFAWWLTCGSNSSLDGSLVLESDQKRYVLMEIPHHSALMYAVRTYASRCSCMDDAYACMYIRVHTRNQNHTHMMHVRVCQFPPYPGLDCLMCCDREPKTNRISSRFDRVITRLIKS
jgi:hypothetical protein